MQTSEVNNSILLCWYVGSISVEFLMYCFTIELVHIGRLITPLISVHQPES